MGARGPAPTPTNVLKARGSWRAKLHPGEPAPPSAPPRCPRRHLSPDAIKEWERIVPILTEMGVATRADANALARYCTFLAQWNDVQAVIAELGGVGAGLHDENVVTARAFRAARDLNENLLRLEGQFGLTPAARSRVSAIDAPVADPAAETREKFFGKAQ